jgi:hypothetical protein
LVPNNREVADHVTLEFDSIDRSRARGQEH